MLSPGDQVRTGAGAEALLLFSNGSTVTVGPDTQVRIDGFVQEEFEGSDQKVGALAAEVSSSRMKLDLEVGELIIGVKKLNKESSLIVSTSMGMAGVRGTHFKIAANKDQTSVCVLSGAVDFQNLKNETRSIAKETKVEATKDALSKPVAIPAVDKARIEAAQQAAKQKTEAVSLGQLSEAFDEMNPKQGEVRSDADLKRYFADLENAVQNNTYQAAAQAAAQAMTAKRGLFANDRGQLQLKLLFDGPEEVWGKVKAGGVGVLPVNTRLEFEHLSAVAGAMGMRDMWRYKLYQCTPVVGDKRPGNPQRYDTKKKLIQEFSGTETLMNILKSPLLIMN